MIFLSPIWRKNLNDELKKKKIPTFESCVSVLN